MLRISEFKDCSDLSDILFKGSFLIIYIIATLYPFKECINYISVTQENKGEDVKEINIT